MNVNGHIPASHGPALRRAGFTLVEAVMSILIVGLMLVAALNTVGASKVAQARNAEHTIGPMLAQELMVEILSQAYQEPDTTPAFGRESGEYSYSRTAYDDVDDYHGWSASPPKGKDNVDLPDLTGWSREVTVSWADSTLPENTALTASGLKRITITVRYQDRVVTVLSALRSNGWPESTTGGDDGGLIGGLLGGLF